MRRALAARDDPRDVAPPSFVETFSWSDAVEREDALQRAADPPAPRENTRGADDRQGHPPGPTPPPRSLRPPPPSTPSPPPDRTFAAVVRPERDDLPVRRASREGFPSLSETPRAREGEEEEKEDEEERAKRAEAEEDRDEEERAKRAEAREDQDEYARATDSITSSDVHGDLDWPDIHAPRLPSKFVATFLWDLPRPSDATVRDADADATRTRTLTRRRRVRRPATCTVARRTPFARRSSPPVCATRCRARFDETETFDARGPPSKASSPEASPPTPTPTPMPTNPTTFFRDRSVRFTRSFAFGDGTTSSFATPCSPPAAARFPSPGSTKTNPWRFASTWTETETGTAIEIERRWHVVSVGVSHVSTGFLSGPGARGDVRARSTRRLSDPSNTPTRRTPPTRNYPRRIRLRRSAAGENEGARRSRDGAARDACRTRLSDAGPYTRDRARRAVRSPTRTGNRECREPPFDAPNREPGTEPSPSTLARSRKRYATPDVRSIPRSSRSRPRQSRRVRVSGAVSAGGGGIAAEVPGVRGQVQGESGARGGTIGDGRVRGVRRGGGGETRKTNETGTIDEGRGENARGASKETNDDEEDARRDGSGAR